MGIYCPKYEIAVYVDDLMIAASPLYFLTSHKFITACIRAQSTLNGPVPFSFFVFYGLGYNINHTSHIKICPNIDISYNGMII